MKGRYWIKRKRRKIFFYKKSHSGADHNVAARPLHGPRLRNPLGSGHSGPFSDRYDLLLEGLYYHESNFYADKNCLKLVIGLLWSYVLNALDICYLVMPMFIAKLGCFNHQITAVMLFLGRAESVVQSIFGPIPIIFQVTKTTWTLGARTRWSLTWIRATTSSPTPRSRSTRWTSSSIRLGEDFFGQWYLYKA